MVDDTALLAALGDLADHVAWPDPTVDVTGRAVAELTSGRTGSSSTHDAMTTRALPEAASEPPWNGRRRARVRAVAAGRAGAGEPGRMGRQRVRVLALAAAAVVTLVVAVVPPTRRVVADLLGIGGVRITLGDGVLSQLDARIDVGRSVSIDDAREMAPEGLVLPGSLGEPTAAFADRPAGAVTFVWAPSATLPEVLDSGVGLLVTAFPAGRDGDEVIAKRGAVGGIVEEVSVDGITAYWLTGAPHEFVYLDELGRPEEDTLRMSGDALVWQMDDVTYRLESALSRTDALHLAESLTR